MNSYGLSGVEIGMVHSYWIHVQRRRLQADFGQAGLSERWHFRQFFIDVFMVAVNRLIPMSPIFRSAKASYLKYPWWVVLHTLYLYLIGTYRKYFTVIVVVIG